MSHTQTPLHTFCLRFAFVGLIVLSCATFMGKSYENSLHPIDSCTHARMALNVTGQGLLPSLPMRNLFWNQQATEGFNEHPFFLFYINGWVMRYFGADAWSARLIPSLFAVGCVLAIVWIGTLCYAFPVGIAAGFILMSSRELIRLGTKFQLDPALVFFILLSFVFWIKKKPCYTAIAVALGLWVKNPVALLIYPSAVFAHLCSKTFTRKIGTQLFFSSLLALFLSSFVWIITGIYGGWHLVKNYWTTQVIGTAVYGRGIETRNIWLWAEILYKTYYPWLFFLFFALFKTFREKKWKNFNVALPLSASIITIVVISAMHFTHVHYYLPLFPFLALLIAENLRSTIERYSLFLSKSIIGLALIIPVFLLITPISLNPEKFFALRKFNAFIQSYGSCYDKVFFIKEMHAQRRSEEKTYECSFYTNRQVIESSCEKANTIISQERADWVILSEEQISCCLNNTVKNFFLSKITIGDQVLLSRKALINFKPSEKTASIDLTPLIRELKAPLDCQAVTINPANP